MLQNCDTRQPFVWVMIVNKSWTAQAAHTLPPQHLPGVRTNSTQLWISYESIYNLVVTCTRLDNGQSRQQQREPTRFAANGVGCSWGLLTTSAPRATTHVGRHFELELALALIGSVHDAALRFYQPGGEGEKARLRPVGARPVLWNSNQLILWPNVIWRKWKWSAYVFCCCCRDCGSKWFICRNFPAQRFVSWLPR